jgi:hypothetical protein
MACAVLVGSASAVEMSLGLKGGLNLAKPWGIDKEKSLINEDDLKMKPGLVIGGACEIKLHEMFSIQPEVLFSVKGMKMEGEMEFLGLTFDYAQEVNINYLEIPILFKLNIPAGAVVPNFYVGPDFAFRIGVGGWVEEDGEKEDLTDEDIDEIKESTNVFDFGMAVGGGINFAAGPGSFVVDVRYTMGFMKIYKLSDEMEESGVSDDNLPPEKNGALSFMIGYMFNIGG